MKIKWRCFLIEARWRRLPDWSWFLQIWAEWQSQGVPRDLRLENWDVNYILNHLSSHLFSSPGTNTAISQPMPEVLVMERESSSLYWNRSVQFYTVIEAFMNIKVGLVYFIHCVGQSLTPWVWVSSLVRWYQVSNTKTNEGTLSLTSNIYISTPEPWLELGQI